jgi:hypothetical protein
MFFAEPARAFANLRTALKSSGRLAFACWRKFDGNPWLQVPLRAGLEHVPPLPRPGSEDPGPFSFASEQRVHRILADAGFHSVILEPRDFDPDIACGGGIEEALEAAMALGPTRRALQDQGPETRAAGCHVDPRALQPYQRGKQVALAGAIWLVTANNAQRVAPESSRRRVGEGPRIAEFASNPGFLTFQLFGNRLLTFAVQVELSEEVRH